MAHYPISGRYDVPMTVEMQEVAGTHKDFEYDRSSSREDVMSRLKHVAGTHDSSPDVIKYLSQFVDRAIGGDSGYGVSATRYFFSLKGALRITLSSRKEDNILTISATTHEVAADVEFLQCDYTMRSIFGMIRGWSCFSPRPPSEAERRELHRLLVDALETAGA